MLMFLIGFEYGAFYAWECSKSVRFIRIRFIGAFTMNHRDQENEYDDIDDFLQAIWLQKSLSDNTLAAYRRDLIKTERWLRGNSKNLVSASGIDLHEYMSNIFGYRGCI